MYKWLMAGVLGLACAVGVLLLTNGMPDRKDTAEQRPSFTLPDVPVDADAGMIIYRSMCLSCHGDQLQGRVGPKLANIGADMSKEQLYAVIANGRGGMPSFEKRLTEDELVTLATWLASLH